MSKDNILSIKSNSANLVVLLHAFAIVCFIAVCWLMPGSFELKTMKNLILSEATANGIDIGMRVNLMYKFIFGGTAAVIALYKLLKYIEVKFAFSFLRHHELILLSVSIICIAFLQVMDAKSLTTLKLLGIIFLFRLCTLLPVKKLNAVIGGILKRKIVFSLCLIFAFYSLFASFFLLGTEEFVRKNIVWIFSAFFLFYCLIYALFCKKNPLYYKQVTAFLLPLSSIPYIAFLSLEAMFYVRQSQGYFISFKWLFVALSGIIWIVMNFFFLRKKVRKISVNTMIRKWIAPSMMVAFVLLAFYTPVQQPVNEMFEFANAANSIMNVFEFGKIPLLDFMSSHIMIEQWYGYLYSFIFGYNASMDFLIYNFLNTLFFYFVLYWFLNKMFHRPLLSLFFLFFFPFVQEVFYLYIFVAVIPFFFSRQLLERPTALAFLKLFLALSLLTLWKLDTGVAAIFAATFYFPLLYFIAKTKFPLKAFLKGLALFGCMLAGLFLIAAVLRSPAIIVNDLKMSLHYFSASQAHGLKEIMTSYAQQFYIYHILFPFIGVVSCGYILITLRKKANTRLFDECHLLLASLFLFLLFFANLQRGLVRHGFAEHGELVLVSTFFAAASLLVVYWFQARRPVINMMLFYVTGCSLFILLKFFPFHTSEATLDFALNNNAISTVGNAISSPGYSGRTNIDTGFARENYLQLKDFLDKNITRDQTFLDFSNTPMLYFYCQRNIPGYFNQNLQNTVDDYLQFELLKHVNTDKVPVVIFASYPRAWFDATDGIPNVVRYYLIAEYIFDHYRPYGVIGNKSVWVSNTFHALPAAATTDAIIAQTDSASLNLIPEYTGSFYSNSEYSKDMKTVFSKTKADFSIQNDSLTLSLDEAVMSLKGCYLSVEFEKRKDWFEPFQTQVLFRDTTGVTVGAFSFTRRDLVSSRYMVRLSNHYFWHRHHPLELRISSAGEIKQISILKDTRVEN